MSGWRIDQDVRELGTLMPDQPGHGLSADTAVNLPLISALSVLLTD